MENIGGIFVVLICGLIIAVFVAIMEFVWSTRRSAETDEVCPHTCPRRPHRHTPVGSHGIPPTLLITLFCACVCVWEKEGLGRFFSAFASICMCLSVRAVTFEVRCVLCACETSGMSEYAALKRCSVQDQYDEYRFDFHSACPACFGSQRALYVSPCFNSMA